MKNKRIAVVGLILILGIFSLVGCNNTNTSQSGEDIVGYKKISAKQAKEMMDNKDYDIILDVRTPEEFAEGFIEGAVNLPLDRIEQDAESIIDSTDSTILLYCRSGNRSAQAGKLLKSLGYTKVYDFGGIIDWPY